MAEVIITKDNFEKEVLQSSLPVLIDFWAVWCGPCKVLSPIVEELAVQYEGKIKVGKVNVDEQSELSEQYQILSIPTLKFFNKGEMLSSDIVGAAPKTTIEAEIKKLIQA